MRKSPLREHSNLLPFIFFPVIYIYIYMPTISLIFHFDKKLINSSKVVEVISIFVRSKYSQSHGEILLPISSPPVLFFIDREWSKVRKQTYKELVAITRSFYVLTRFLRERAKINLRLTSTIYFYRSNVLSLRDVTVAYTWWRNNDCLRIISDVCRHRVVQLCLRYLGNFIV